MTEMLVNDKRLSLWLTAPVLTQNIATTDLITATSQPLLCRVTWKRQQRQLQRRAAACAQIQYGRRRKPGERAYYVCRCWCSRSGDSPAGGRRTGNLTDGTDLRQLWRCGYRRAQRRYSNAKSGGIGSAPAPAALNFNPSATFMGMAKV